MKTTKTITSAIKNNSFWKVHFEQFKSGQLSKTAYARKHNLAKHRFIYWIGKFETALIKATAAKSDFIPITIKQPAFAPDSTVPVLCTLQLSDGKKLWLHSEVAMKLCLESWR